MKENSHHLVCPKYRVQIKWWDFYIDKIFRTTDQITRPIR